MRMTMKACSYLHLPVLGLQVKLATLYPDCNLDHGSCEAQPATLDSDCYLDHTSREARE